MAKPGGGPSEAPVDLGTGAGSVPAAPRVPAEGNESGRGSSSVRKSSSVDGG